MGQASVALELQLYRYRNERNGEWNCGKGTMLALRQRITKGKSGRKET